MGQRYRIDGWNDRSTLASGCPGGVALDVVRELKIVRGPRVLTQSGIQPAAIHISGGVIAAVSAYDDVPREAQPFEVGKALIMPGVVDSHVHVNEPGRTEWEGFASATRAAAAGGITTIVDMPLNSIPATTTVHGLEVKRAAAAGQCWVDVAFWGGVIPGNVDDLLPMVEAGVCGFKCFLAPSGVDEFPHVDEAALRLAMPRLADAGVPLLVHAELAGPIEAAERAAAAHSSLRYLTYLTSRPSTAEQEAVALMTHLCKAMGTRVHIVHNSAATTLPILQAARHEGLPMTAETCPHYLTLDAESIPDGATLFKCAPPIREHENQDRLWRAGLDAGVLDMVVSDHSPCTPELKRTGDGDFMAAWGGIASLQLSLPIVWTRARARGVPVERVAEWMCRAPARLCGLSSRKGALAPGYDADLVIWEPEAAFAVKDQRIHHRHPGSPYADQLLYGRVGTTIVGGKIVYDRGTHSEEPNGRLIARG